MGVLFQKIGEGEPSAQRRVSLPQISLAILAAETGKAATETGTTEVGTGTMAAETGTMATGTSTARTGTGTMATETGTTSANLEATLDTMTDEDIDASLDGWLGQFALAPHLPPPLHHIT